MRLEIRFVTIQTLFLLSSFQHCLTITFYLPSYGYTVYQHNSLPCHGVWNLLQIPVHVIHSRTHIAEEQLMYLKWPVSFLWSDEVTIDEDCIHHA